jgi:hypothetical protein
MNERKREVEKKEKLINKTKLTSKKLHKGLGK